MLQKLSRKMGVVWEYIYLLISHRISQTSSKFLDEIAFVRYIIHVYFCVQISGQYS